MVTKKKEGFHLMREKCYRLFKYSTLAIVIVFGLITIIGTGGDDDKKSVHTSNIEGLWEVTYTYLWEPGEYGPYIFEFTQEGNDVTFTGKFQTAPYGEVYNCIGEGVIEGDELTIIAWNDDENLTVTFYTGLIDNLDTRIVGMVENNISWHATWGDGNSASGRWSADKCGS
jgi:hypothetical protein